MISVNQILNKVTKLAVVIKARDLLKKVFNVPKIK